MKRTHSFPENNKRTKRIKNNVIMYLDLYHSSSLLERKLLKTEKQIDDLFLYISKCEKYITSYFRCREEPKENNPGALSRLHDRLALHVKTCTLAPKSVEGMKVFGEAIRRFIGEEWCMNEWLCVFIRFKYKFIDNAILALLGQNDKKRFVSMQLMEKPKLLFKCNTTIIEQMMMENENDARIIVNYYPFYLNIAPEKVRDDRDFLLNIIERSGLCLEFVSKRLQNDEEFVLIAVEEDGYALRYASEELRSNKKILLAAVTSTESYFKHFPSKLRNDREIVLEVVGRNGLCLKYVSDIFRNDKEIVLKAIEQDWKAFEYVSDAFKDNRDIVIEAVKIYPRLVRIASSRLRDDRDVVMEVISRWGDYLRRVPKFKDDKEIVMKAVKNNGLSIQYASETLKNDLCVVLEAVRQNVDSLEYVSCELRVYSIFQTMLDNQIAPLNESKTLDGPNDERTK